MITAADVATVYETQYERMVYYAYRRTGDMHEAEDITSTVFCRVLEHCDSIEHVMGYIYRGIKNGMIDRARRYNRTQEHALEVLDYDYRIEFEPELYYERDLPQIRHAARLTELQEQVIDYLLEGYAFVEIAELMNMSEGAVKALRHRAMIKMREVRYLFVDEFNANPVRRGARRPVRVRYR